jgi:hypothetical protein
MVDEYHWQAQQQSSADWQTLISGPTNQVEIPDN